MIPGSRLKRVDAPLKETKKKKKKKKEREEEFERKDPVSNKR